MATPVHGTLVGNRGCLQDDGRRVVRTSARVAWVTCRLDWKDIRRTIMTPGKYTELFVLDEATALAAGHRPCGDCRAERLVEFERDGVQRCTTARAGGLPDGVMVQLPGEEGIARLICAGGARLSGITGLRWSSRAR